MECQRCTEDRPEKLFVVGATRIYCRNHAQPWVDAGHEAVSKADSTVRLSPTPPDAPMPPLKLAGGTLGCFTGKPAADPSAVVWSDAWVLPVAAEQGPLRLFEFDDD